MAWAAELLGGASGAAGVSGSAGGAGTLGMTGASAAIPAALGVGAGAAAPISVPAGTGASAGLASQLAPTMASPLAGAGSISGEAAAPALSGKLTPGASTTLSSSLAPTTKTTPSSASKMFSDYLGLQEEGTWGDKARAYLRDQLKKDPQAPQLQLQPLQEYQADRTPPSAPVYGNKEWSRIMQALMPKQGGY